MKPEVILTPKFLQYIPDKLEKGILYLSIEFATASHSCACGCGHEVVTPLSPTDWKLIFDGATVSLDPSIGNWSFPCQSHYWITRNKVQWAPKWSKEQINAGRYYDSFQKRRYFEKHNDTRIDHTANGQPKIGFWQRIKQKLF